jgi:hypothetical protein
MPNDDTVNKGNPHMAFTSCPAASLEPGQDVQYRPWHSHRWYWVKVVSTEGAVVLRTRPLDSKTEPADFTAAPNASFRRKTD